MNVNVEIFFNTGYCTYHGSSEMKCPMSRAKKLNNIPPALNPTLNLSDSVNKTKFEIKTNL